MRPVKNRQIRIKRKKLAPDPPNPYTHYKCRFCQAIDSGRVYWSETRYGRADLRDLDGELDNYDDQDSDNFNIDNYQCWECDEESNSRDILFVACNESGEVDPNHE